MSKFALVLLALVAALSIACGDDDDDTTDATTEPVATSAAPASSTEAASVASDGTSSEPVAFESTQFSPAISGEAATSWSATDDLAKLFVLEHHQADDGPAGYISPFYPLKVYSYDGLTQEDIPADFGAWIMAHPRLTILNDQPVVVGGLEGVQYELASEELDEWAFLEDELGTFDVNYSDHFVLYILETSAGQMLMFVGAEEPNRFEQFLPAAAPVVATLEFAE